MILSPQDRLRRGLGILFLAISGLMTSVGLTWLDSSLRGVLFLGYWSVAGGTALAAFACALLDMRVMRERIEAEQRALFRAYFDGPGRSAGTTPPAVSTPRKSDSGGVHPAADPGLTPTEPPRTSDPSGQKI
jgi:hypothetical protein